MSSSRSPLVLALLGAVLPLGAASPGAAAATPAAPAAGQTDEGEEAPTPAPLTTGSMAIASDPNLVVEAMAVDVAMDRVAYSYRLRNKGPAKLALAASVALPDLEVSSEGDTTYVLPSADGDNPIDLAVRSGDQAVATAASVQAVALGLDRLADIKAAGLPLLPFGPAQDKALAALKPEALGKLADLGLVTPRDPAQPDAPVIADWTLRIVRGWTQALEPNATTPVTVSFAPVKASYRVDAAGLAGFNALKDQVCLTPAISAAARALLKGKEAQLDVQDITLSNDGPARWLDNPAASIAVRKPQPTSVVAFCGVDAASAAKPVVTGRMPGANEAAGLRVLVFSVAAK